MVAVAVGDEDVSEALWRGEEGIDPVGEVDGLGGCEEGVDKDGVVRGRNEGGGRGGPEGSDVLWDGNWWDCRDWGCEVDVG